MKKMQLAHNMKASTCKSEHLAAHTKALQCTDFSKELQGFLV